MKFSVIIPLEFNRGLAVRCIRSWVQNQSHDRDDYEILVVASETHAPGELQDIRRLLLPQDRLVQFPVTHDMALVAAAAVEACGDVFVFTESHCLPEPDFLERAGVVLEEHSEWGGFSGISFPLTHNLLSVIESELYERDIKSNLTRHEWLKVLDQCFVIRRAEYHLAGGIEARYGHFAEWLLAGRFHSKGILIGHAPEVRVGHYYIGDFEELEAFTLDFTEGEMRFASQAVTDPCASLFKKAQEWKRRSRWNKELIGSLVQAVQSFRKNARGEQEPQAVANLPRIKAPILRILTKCWVWKTHSLASAIRLARWHLALLVWLLRFLLFIRWKQGAKHFFQRWIVTLVRLGRLNFLRDFYDNPGLPAGTLPSAVKEWTPATAIGWESLGFHEWEKFQGTPFRWSEPVACIRLLLGPGSWKITLHLPPILPSEVISAARFFINSRPVSGVAMDHTGTRIEILCPQHQGGALDLAWICGRFEAPRDRRHLGLPFAKIEWWNTKEENIRDTVRVHNNSETIYFSHVPKCAGTTICSLLENHYRSDDCLTPYTDIYYARELKARKDSLRPAPFIVGHFGWELPGMYPDHSWRILTLLREPQERMLSLFDYLVQHRRISPLKSFMDWLEQDARPSHFLLPHFVPGLLETKTRGMLKWHAQLTSHLDEALGNLRKCVVVGLQEKIEDSINLFCAATGCYPPREAAQLNVTLQRRRLEDFSAHERSRLEHYLGSERILYGEAVKLFDRQLARLHQEASRSEGRSLNQEDLRTVLRKNYFQRCSAEIQAGPSRRPIVWRPESAYMGDNLHARECHAGQSLRWTGPEPKTAFYLPVGIDLPEGFITLNLHPATPLSHAESTLLTLNGQEVPLELRSSPEGIVLAGSFCSRPNPGECGAYAELVITTPTTRGQHEFRTIGIALQEIRICL